MNHQRFVKINLASQPVRNRRLFHLLLSVVGVGILVLALAAGRTFLSYEKKHSEVHSSLVQVQELIRENQRTHRKFSREIQNLAQNYQKKIDRVNEIIYKKSFSWVEFLSGLEYSLPSSCYIVSLSPSQKGNSQLKVRFQVVSPHLDDLLKLIERMEAQNFKDIRVISESKNEKGDLISDISLTYETPRDV